MYPLHSLQKVSIAGVLVFTDPNFTQTLTGKLISIFWFGVLTLIAPYETTGENLCAFVLNLSVCVIMVGGVATKVLALQVALAQITDAAFETLIDPDFADAVPWTAMAVSLVSFVVALAREWRTAPAARKTRRTTRRRPMAAARRRRCIPSRPRRTPLRRRAATAAIPRTASRRTRARSSSRGTSRIATGPSRR